MNDDEILLALYQIVETYAIDHGFIADEGRYDGMKKAAKILHLALVRKPFVLATKAPIDPLHLGMNVCKQTLTRQIYSQQNELEMSKADVVATFRGIGMRNVERQLDKLVPAKAKNKLISLSVSGKTAENAANNSVHSVRNTFHWIRTNVDDVEEAQLHTLRMLCFHHSYDAIQVCRDNVW